MPSAQNITLHPHPASKVLPLLASHLPYSLPVYGTLVSTPSSPLTSSSSADGDVVKSSGEEVTVWATFDADAIPSPRRARTKIETGSGKEEREEHEEHEQHEEEEVDEVWTVIVSYAGVKSHQTRMYCSAEHPSYTSTSISTSPPPAPSHPLGAVPAQGETDTIIDDTASPSTTAPHALARQQVLSAHRAYITQVDPLLQIAGCVHSLWVRAVEDAWGVKGEERRGYCGAWVKRVGPGIMVEQNGRIGQDQKAGSAGGEVAEGMGRVIGADLRPFEQCGEELKSVEVSWGGARGCVVRLGKEEDVDSFIQHTDIKRTVAYYRSRLPFSSILAMSSSPKHVPTSCSASVGPLSTATAAHDQSTVLSTPLSDRMIPSRIDASLASASTDTVISRSAHEHEQIVAQVLTHADGTLGSLYTFPEFRRRGLGAALVREHIASGRGVVSPRTSRRHTHRIRCSYPETVSDTCAPGSNALEAVEAVREDEGVVNGIRAGPSGSTDTSTNTASDLGVAVEGFPVSGSTKSDRDNDEDGWAWTHIFYGNEASEAVFRALGFEKMWDVAWVYRPQGL